MKDCFPYGLSVCPQKRGSPRGTLLRVMCFLRSQKENCPHYSPLPPILMFWNIKWTSAMQLLHLLSVLGNVTGEQTILKDLHLTMYQSDKPTETRVKPPSCKSCEKWLLLENMNISGGLRKWIKNSRMQNSLPRKWVGF